MVRSISLLAVVIVATSPAFAADLPGGAGVECLPKQAMNSLLPAAGYSQVQRLGAQGGVTYFDARKGGAWFRVGVDSCTQEIASVQHEKTPLGIKR